MARLREFEPEEALAAIKAVFWRYGYEGASMQMIEAATGLKKQSLYRLFGDKRGMYLAAVDHYGRHEVAEAAALLEQAGDARRRFMRLFDGVIDSAGKEGDRRGYFLVNASVDQAPSDDATRKLVGDLMGAVRASFEKALSVSAPYDQDRKAREAKADQLLATFFGMKVLVRAGAPVAQLKAAAREAIAGV